MKITKQIQVPCMGGGFNTVTETITEERKGQKLGSLLRPGLKLETVQVSHIEDENDGEMFFDETGWIPKSLIQSLKWHNDGYGAVVVAVTFKPCLSTTDHAAQLFQNH